MLWWGITKNASLKFQHIWLPVSVLNANFCTPGNPAVKHFPATWEIFPFRGRLMANELENRN